MTGFWLSMGILLLAVGALAVCLGSSRNLRLRYEREKILLHHLMKYHTGMVAVTDAKGNIRIASESFERRFSPPGTIGLAGAVIPDFFSEDSRFDYGNIINYVFRNRKPLREFRVTTQVGEETREMLLTVVPVFDGHDHRVGLINVFGVARKRPGGNGGFEHVEKLTNVGQIAAGIAHEMNTPLGSIILSTDIIAELDCPSQVVAEAKEIKRQAVRCSRVVKELLGYVRKDERVKTTCLIAAIVERVRSLVAPELLRRQITFSLREDVEGIAVNCDENQFEQLFFNLFSNSIHAVKERGHIGISISNDALLNRAVVTFEDTGGGIPSEHIDKIFDPFFTTKSGDQGTGLGLALCRRIVVEHEGKIDVRSTPGRGTTFVLTFPAIS